MSSLKLGPMPTTRTTKLSITIPAPLHDALELYRRAYENAFEPVDLGRLIPHMVQTFLLSDRFFMAEKGNEVRALLNPPLLVKPERGTGNADS